MLRVSRKKVFCSDGDVAWFVHSLSVFCNSLGQYALYQFQINFTATNSHVRLHNLEKEMIL